MLVADAEFINSDYIMKQLLNLLKVIVILAVTGCSTEPGLQVFDLRCENLYNPLGIDNTAPRLSWKIRSSNNGTEQSAYQILVAGSPEGLTLEESALWNSGKTESANSILIPYNGRKLNSGVVVWWKVRVWDEAGNASEWSEPASFSVGLLDADDWQALYIACDTDYREAPQVYTTFSTDDPGAEHYLHVNSLGYHEVYLNGQKVGDGVLAPAVSQFNKRSLINTYNVTPYLKDGQNELIIWLGSGWYTEGLPGVVNNGPVVRAQLEKIGAGERDVILATNSSWQGRKSSYTRHGTWRPDQFGGEIKDGRIAEDDLNINNKNNPWKQVSVVDVPAHDVSPQMVEHNAITDTIKPLSIEETGNDTLLVDMGTNITGWVKINFPDLHASQEIKMEYCDHLVDGVRFNDRNQYDMYIASGSHRETFINKFNYHGFRYIRITGLEEMLSPDSVEAYLVHTGFETASGFECSDDDMNAIHDMLFYTLKCLSIGGDFVDCPQIERLGYGGDGNASALTSQIMFDLGPLYSHWLQVWADVIREDGSMPHTAPNPYPAGGGPYWCGFIITASWNAYLHYGDSTLLERHYPVMQSWLGYVEQHSVDGLLKRWPDTDYRNWYLGDWATPDGINQTDEASVDLVNNSFVAVCYDRMERIARLLGRNDDAAGYATRRNALQEKIHSTFFDEEASSYATGTQIDLAFPLIAGVVPQNKRQEVEQTLHHVTKVNWDGHLATGLVGLPVITEWAVNNNAVDLVYSMLKKRDYPGFLYMIDNGATTTWEHWGGQRSRIHNCYNGIGSWFYQGIGGIRQADDVPAYRKVCIQPQIPDGITWANTWKNTPYGKLIVQWKLNEGQLELDLEIPVGVEAEVNLPENYTHYKPAGNIKQNIHGNIDVKSGRYSITFRER